VYAARMYISTANPDAVSTQGTVIGEALRKCNESLDTKERKYKSVLLITDGEDHDEEALKSAKELGKNGMIVNTVGIGSVNGSTITDPQTGETKKDANGQPVVSKLNEKILMEIASSSGGIYQNLSDVQSTVDVILKQLNGMEKKTIVGNSWVNYKTLFFWFVAAALVFLVLEIFLPDRKKQNV
jgi:Ca-activated chloride channel homolog